jgi:hypothetical protein
LDLPSRAIMGERSRAIIEQRFNEELVAQAYVMALAQVTGHGQSAS